MNYSTATVVVNALTGEPLGEYYDFAFPPNWKGSPPLFLGNTRITTAEHYRNTGVFEPPPEPTPRTFQREYSDADIAEYLAQGAQEPDPLEVREQRREAVFEAYQQKNVGDVYGNDMESIHVSRKKSGEPYQPPGCEDDEFCLNPRFRVRRRYDGKVAKFPYRCRECGPDLLRWQRGKAHRHDWGDCRATRSDRDRGSGLPFRR